MDRTDPRLHHPMIALTSGHDFSPLVRISSAKSAGIQSTKAALKVGRSLTTTQAARCLPVTLTVLWYLTS
jgi:hypothetical protein